MNNDIVEANLRRRLQQAEKTLAQLKRYYKGDESFYRDQIDYIKALREHLASMP